MEKLLLIEDDKLILESTSEFLKECGYTVITATDGMTGFQKAVEHYPDLILSDIAMPVFDGIKVYEMLQQNADTALIPFIFLTAMAEKDDIRTGMQLGADDYITKPFDLDELHTAIKTRLIKSNKMKKIISDQYLTLFENPLSGVYIIDNQQPLFLNRKFGKIFNVEVDDNQKEKVDFISLFPKKEQPLLNEKINKCLKGLVIHFNHEFHIPASKVLINMYGKRATMKGKNVIIGNVLENGYAGDKALNELMQAPDDIYTMINQLMQNDIDDGLRLKIEAILTKNDEKPQVPENPDNLSSRETEVLRLICEGMNTAEISEKLFISERTVDTHRANLLSKTGVNNTASLVIYAIRNGFVNT